MLRMRLGKGIILKSYRSVASNEKKIKRNHCSWMMNFVGETDCGGNCGGNGSLLLPIIVLSCVQLCVTLWTVASLSLGFSRQEHWSGLPFSPPGGFPFQGLNVRLLSPALAGRLFTTPPGKPPPVITPFHVITASTLWR